MRAFSAACALAAVVAVSAPSCVSADADTSSPLLDNPSLVVGVTASQPGMGIELQKGHYEGFDVDVARYITNKLGFEPQDVSFVSANEENGEELLNSGQADLVLAAYSVTPKRKTRLEFAGPYYLGHLDILVRAENQSIKTVRDLEHRRLCVPPGSLAWTRIAATLGVPVRRVDEPNESECVAAVRAGEADAVSAVDLVLAGMMQYNSAGLKIVNAPFTDERWGVAIRKGDVEGCEAINRAITQMYQDGSAAKYLNKWFGLSNLDISSDVPQFEGCG